MFESATVISLLETQKDALAFWLVKRFDGVCTQLGCDQPRNGSFASFLLDLANATRVKENVHISMIHLK